MSSKKRWLIIYVSAGQGHRIAAESLYKYIKEGIKGIEVTVLDALDLCPSLFKRIYNQGYKFLVTKVPFLWKISYLLSEIGLLNPFRFIINRIFTKGLESYISGYQPQIVLITHFLPLEVVSYLKKKGLISTLLAVVVTDFSVHPFWISREVDRFFVASCFTKDKLIKEGIDKDKISITGIPIDLKFSLDLDKESLIKKLNLKENIFTVLITTAGFGLGPIEKLVELLHREVQLLVVCGYNHRLFRILKARYPQVRVFGFVDNMEELMTVSHMIITKPGGLTVSEAIAKEIPMVFISPIFGQETENIKIIKKMGVGLAFDKIEDIMNFILKCKNNPQILYLIKKNISSIKKPYATKEIIDALR